MTWGAHWGAYWGGEGISSVGDDAVWPISERQLWATVRTKPPSTSAIALGDALNPKSWSVRRLDTNEDLIVLGVKKITDHTFELYTLGKFGTDLIDHEVSGSFSGVNPYSMTFVGCYFNPETEVPGAMVDFANPYFDNGSQPSGTLKVGSDGDYAKQSGVSLLRKLVIRRLTTTPNEFFHMDPESYGVGLRLKEIPTLASLPALRAYIVNQLMKEPEFTDVKVKLTLSSDGAMIVLIKAVLALTGKPVDIPIPAITGSIAL